MQQVNAAFSAALQKAIEHLSRGDGDKVVATCQKLLKKYPDNFDVLHLLGVGFRLQGRFDRALTFYKKALRANPNGSATLYCNLAFAYLENSQDEVFNADECARRARELAPNLQEVYEVSADVSLRVGDAFSAERYLDKSLEISPENPKLWIKRARAQSLGLLDKALESVERAIELDPVSPESYVELGDVRERRGETEQALAAYRSAIEKNHQDPEEVDRKVLAMLSTHGKKELLVSRAQEILRVNPDYVPAHLQLLRAGVYPGGTQKGVEYFTRHKKSRTDMIEFAIADGFDKEKRYDESFQHYLRANRKKLAQEVGYKVQQTVDHYKRIRDFYSTYSETILDSPSDLSKYPTPIFILGMPRSGTSLTEQLLGSHSEIQPAGELQFLLALCKFGMSEFRGDQKQRTLEYWNWVRDTYLKSIQRISDGKQFVVDKMPHNYEVTGFVRKLFPNAVIVHSRRNSVSNCLSIFKANFSGYHPYAQDLKSIGQYYCQYWDLMNFWKEQSGIEIIESQYEDLVRDSESQIKSILEACDLEWEEQINDFHNSDRIVRTSSNDQVRQPIYQTSVEGWRQYQRYLSRLTDVLLENGLVTKEELG